MQRNLFSLRCLCIGKIVALQNGGYDEKNQKE